MGASRWCCGLGAVAGILAVLLCPGAVRAWPMPDSGQVGCYGESGEISCPLGPDSFYGQDATYNINPPSYVKLDLDGNELDESAPVWASVRDRVTGLVWEAKGSRNGIKDYANPNDADNTYTWYDPDAETNGGNEGVAGDGTDTRDFIQDMNAAGYGGYTDWRLPTNRELMTLFHPGQSAPLTDVAFFPETKIGEYWSSTTYAYPGMESQAWYLDFYFGCLYRSAKSGGKYVRAVRGPTERVRGRFVDNGDDTVTDTMAGLMWGPTSDTQKTWEHALSHCETLAHAGYGDWRLPNIKELVMLADFSRTSPGADPAWFPDTETAIYWSSTTNHRFFTEAWRVDFGDGNTGGLAKTYARWVRPVRGGQNVRPGHPRLTSPTQGSLWEKGSSMPITWETAGLGGNVQIGISRQGGVPDTFDVIATTANDGEYTWTVDGVSSVNCVLRIVSDTDPGEMAEQGLFSILGLAVTGRVVADVAGHAGLRVRDATVVLTSATGGTAEAWTDQNGDFRFYNTPEGDYTLCVSSAGLVLDCQIVSVVSGQLLDLGLLTPMQPGAGDCRAEVAAERARWDADGDGAKGLAEAMEALQVVSSLRQDP
ncbi:MAG: DUF1566 domain-containing protein [Desulfatibacillaceae bacterium]